MDQPDKKDHLTAEMKVKLMDWIIQVSDEFHFQEDTLHMTIGLVVWSLALGKFVGDNQAHLNF